ncbi:DUF397 domain-containing protein [Actinopolyspora erythraea]|uniref:DUF397 domain-containing protein n=1 Tax=Actinopolyspora erythraea TaxID=414996 RepID=A0A099D299_9ACTN|nr:DUF397 domain-containing protein [Actinopolyspora erythraea]ASU77809.1 DUF397 domain-containing protein [Actinopolyspora erythraea]KGI80026.1 regulator [Actinopolyspora erythraea]
MSVDWSRMTFHKAEASSIEGTECVEVARSGDTFGIRNSREPDGPVLEFTRAEMIAFASGIRNGEFGV